MLHPTLDPKAPRTLLAKGLPASPGAASGAVVFNADEAESRAQKGEAVILVRIETSPEDIHGMHAARGILTTRGGMTSHAAVVARGMGRPCVAGAGGITVDYNAQTLSAGGKTVRAGETITLDGATGEVFVGTVAMIEPAMSERLRHADGLGRQGSAAWACAPTPKRRWTPRPRASSAPRASACAAPSTCSSIPKRIGAVRQMIMASDEAGRRAALARLLPFQRDDFRELFRIMAGLPVTIRLLDPPLHEFLPHADAEMEEVAQGLGTDVEAIRRRARGTGRSQPDAGPSRLPAGHLLPGNLRDAGARDLRGRARRWRRKPASAPHPEIMIPLVAHAEGAGDHPRAGGQGGGGGVRRSRHARSNTASAR